MNSGWWYDPSSLLKMARFNGQIFLMRFALVSQFANNPERQNVLYTLFSSESVIGFDEIWNVIREISPAYFTGLYKKKMEEDPRPNIRRYMKLFYGRFLYLEGENNKSRETLEDILYNTYLDTAHEKLFLARLYEGLVETYDESGRKNDRNSMIALLYRTYPQLIPYSGFKINMRLSISGIDDKTTRSVTGQIKDCRINFVNEADKNSIFADINFQKSGEKYEATFSTTTFDGRQVVAPG